MSRITGFIVSHGINNTEGEVDDARDVNLNPWNDDRLCNVGFLMNDVRWCVANDFYVEVTYVPLDS